jgi:AcrR family transcriptional regulator
VSEVRPPVQDRARRGLHRLLEATAELLADRSFDEITVDEIVERAGYTKGAFYHRFESKADLLRHLIRRLTAGALEAWDRFLAPSAWEGASLAEVSEALVRRLVAVYVRSGNVMRAFIHEVQWGADAEFRASAAHLNERIRAGVVLLVRERAEQLTAHAREDPDAAVAFWLGSLAAALQSSLLWPQPGLHAPAAPSVLEQRVLRLMVPYLVAGWTPGPADGAAAAGPDRLPG